MKDWLRQPESESILQQQPLIGFALHRGVFAGGSMVDYVFLQVNAAFEEFTGLQAKEIVGRSVTETIPEIKESDFIQVYGQVLTSQKSRRIQRFVPPLERWYDISVFALDEVTFATLFLDITKERTATTALQRSEARLRAIIEDQTELICRFDLQGRLTFVNQAYCQYFAKEAEELLGRSFLPLIPEADQGISEKNVAKLSRENPVVVYEHRVIVADGEVRWQQWTDRAIFSADGSITEYQAVGRDITELKRAQFKLEKTNDLLEELVEKRTMQLQQEKERLAATLASIGDAVITTDEDGKVMSINLVGEEMTGWTLEQATGLVLEKVMVLETTDKDQVLVSRDGTRRRVSMTKSEMWFDNKHFGHVYVLHDITAQRKLEQQLSLARKLQAVGRLATGIAHEINTPLQYIAANVSYLRKTCSDMGAFLDKTAVGTPEMRQRLQYLKQEVPRALQETEEGVARVKEIIGAMKSFAHPSAGKKHPVSINQVLQETLRISRNEWKHLAEVSLDLEPDLPLVPCAFGEISQALLSIILNGADAIRRAIDKKLVQFGQLSLATLTEGAWVVIQIKDNGVGIEPEIQEQIFDMFFTTKEIGDGTGQGLPIAYDIIVNRHQGRLQFNTKPNQGTMFTIKLRHQGNGEE